MCSNRYRLISQDFINNVATNLETYDDQELENALKDCGTNQEPTADNLVFKTNCQRSGVSHDNKEEEDDEDDLEHDESVSEDQEEENDESVSKSEEEKEEDDGDDNDEISGVDMGEKFLVIGLCGTR